MGNASRKIDRIYTDGACSGNPGPGGWGTVIYFSDGTIQELGGADPQTTNNRMEMQAAIAGLEFLQASGQTDPLTLYTDSEYLKKGITQWIAGWKRKGWKTSAGKPVLNQDLWETLDALQQSFVRWEYVRGHSGDPGNERCDEIARSFSLGKPLSLRQPDDTSPITSPEQPSLFSSQADLTPSSPTMRQPSDIPTPDRRAALQILIETLRIADEIARHQYHITTQELANLVGVEVTAIGDRGPAWTWRNWQVSQVNFGDPDSLWQLHRTADS